MYLPHLPHTASEDCLLTLASHREIPIFSRLFPNRPTVAFRTHKSIRKQLTRATLDTHKIDRELTGTHSTHVLF